MGRGPPEHDTLGQHPVVGAAHGELRVPGSRDGVGHHGHVNVVQLAQPDELGLAAQELNAARPAQLVPVLDLDVLLGGHGEQGDAARQGLHDPRGLQAHGRRDHRADLAVVAAGVGRARGRVGVGVAGHDQGVELAHDGHGGASPPGVQHRSGTSQRDAPLDRNAQRGQLVGDDPCRALLPESGLRVIEDVLRYPHGLTAPAVDLRAGEGLQLISGHCLLLLVEGRFYHEELCQNRTGGLSLGKTPSLATGDRRPRRGMPSRIWRSRGAVARPGSARRQSPCRCVRLPPPHTSSCR